VITNEMIAMLYRCSDIYVAPYASEGFNLPVLESMASGTPVIVTRGGSTDDFTSSTFARYIKSELQQVTSESNELKRFFRVHINSLKKEMRFVLKDFSKNMKWLINAGKVAAKVAEEKYSWSKIVELLIPNLVI